MQPMPSTVRLPSDGNSGNGNTLLARAALMSQISHRRIGNRPLWVTGLLAFSRLGI
jgi:hypothetical protein